MALAPVPRRDKDTSFHVTDSQSDQVDWVRVAAGGALLAGGILILAGQKRAGMAAAATGTALAMLDEHEALRSWWRQLPGYVDQVQRVISQVQDAVEDIAEKRESLRRVLMRADIPV
jgi:hypothetical protein